VGERERGEGRIKKERGILNASKLRGSLGKINFFSWVS
jgi:hypothetical protein